VKVGISHARERPDKLGAKGLGGGTASTRRKTARLAGDPEHLTAGQPMALVTVDAARGPIFQAWGLDRASHAPSRCSLARSAR
jgi:hypothetical protein